MAAAFVLFPLTRWRVSTRSRRSRFSTSSLSPPFGRFVGGAAPFGPGATSTFEFDARRGAHVSLVSMLVNTNDAFTGLDSVRLGNGTQVYEVGAYDAGTEVNNENSSHIPGPVGNNPFVRDPEGGVIAHHEGILGVGDTDPAIIGWEGPVARITIERVG